MADFLGMILREDVNDPKKFAEYCQQYLGVPYPTQKDMVISRRMLKQLFARYPLADYGTMCRVVDWCKARNKRPATLSALVCFYRYAWSDGYLPELDPHEPGDAVLEQKIANALRIEDDPVWRNRLENSTGLRARQDVFNGWWQLRRPVFVLRNVK